MIRQFRNRTRVRLPDGRKGSVVEMLPIGASIKLDDGGFITSNEALKLSEMSWKEFKEKLPEIAESFHEELMGSTEGCGDYVYRKDESDGTVTAKQIHGKRTAMWMPGVKAWYW